MEPPEAPTLMTDHSGVRRTRRTNLEADPREMDPPVEDHPMEDHPEDHPRILGIPWPGSTTFAGE